MARDRTKQTKAEWNRLPNSLWKQLTISIIKILAKGTEMSFFLSTQSMLIIL